MGQKTQWSCDGCGETAVTAREKNPDNWHQVTITWTGLAGYPSCEKDGGVTADLCGYCSKKLAGHIRPHSWPKHAKAEASL